MTAPPVATSGGLAPRAVRAFLWAAAAFGSNKLIAFVGTVVLARLLVPEHFGLAAAGIAVLAYLEMVLDLGVGSAVVYEQEEGITDRVRTAFTLNLGIGVLLAGGLVALAPLVAAFFRAGDHAALFRFLGLYVVIRAAAQVPDAVLRRDLDFRRRMAVDVSRAAVRVAVAIPLALLGAGAWSIVIGMTAGELVGTLVTWIAARFRPTLRVDRAAVRTLVGYGGAMLGVRFVAELGVNGDYLVVGNRLGPDALGIYTIAYRIPELVLVTVFWLYSSVAFPVYSQASRSGTHELRSGMLRAIRLTSLFAFPAGIGLALVAHDAIHVLFSDRWAAAVAPMVILSLALAVGSIEVASGDVLPSIGRPGLLFVVNLIQAVPMLTVMVLVAHRGLTAVAIVVLVGQLVYTPILQGVVNRQVGASAGQVVRALVPAVVVGGGVAVTAGAVRLLLEPGPLRLVSTITAGVLGAAIGLLAGGRAALPDLRALSRHARRG